MLKFQHACVLAFVLSSCGAPSRASRLADGPAPAPDQCPDAIGDAAIRGTPALSVTKGNVTVASGQTLAYTVTSGYLPVGKPGVQGGPTHGCMFFFAYTRDDKAGDAAWPITYASNGGPGSPSDWVQLGGLGPKVITLGQDGLNLTGDVLSDDKETLLTSTDLVFVDPISTGYSRVASGIDPSEFDGQVQEAQSIGDFIKTYSTTVNRPAAPFYVLGESYGGMRLPVLGRYLDETLKLKPAGLIFISPWLDALEDDTDDITNDLPYATQLPQYATAAWYHGKLGADLQALSLEQVWEQASAFASGGFLSALVQGDDLSATELASVAATASRFTGAPAKLFVDADLRFADADMIAAILGSTTATWSAYDGRLVQDNVPKGGDPYDQFDPIWTEIEATYFPQTLGIKTDLTYQSNNFSAWPAENPNGYMRSVEDLATFMTNNPAAKIYVASGLYDFVCPAARVRYQLRHLPEADYSRLKFGNYPGGHPIYFGEGARTDFSNTLSQFIGSGGGQS